MRAAVVVLAIVIVAIAVLWAFQRRLIYHPDTSPAAVDGLAGQAVSLRTTDGHTLNAWYLPPSGRARGANVLVCNGNAGNIGDRALLAEALSRNGVGVLLFDYRGYGGNAGAPTEAGLARDADAAGRWLAEHHPDDRLVYFGESLGAAVCAGLAQREPPDGLVLRSPFPSLAAAARAAVGVPVGWLLRDSYDVTGALRDLDAPLLVIAVTDDEVVPAGLSRAAYRDAAEPKQLVEIDGVGHNDRALLDGRQMIDAVIAFIDGLPATDRRP